MPRPRRPTHHGAVPKSDRRRITEVGRGREADAPDMLYTVEELRHQWEVVGRRVPAASDYIAVERVSSQPGMYRTAAPTEPAATTSGCRRGGAWSRWTAEARRAPPPPRDRRAARAQRAPDARPRRTAAARPGSRRGPAALGPGSARARRTSVTRTPSRARQRGQLSLVAPRLPKPVPQRSQVYMPGPPVGLVDLRS